MTFFLGLTGGIATGKSTADAFFKSKNIPVIDADQVAHDLMKVGQASYNAVVAAFGSKILNDDQTIDRQKLGQLVFNDASLLAKLNKATHPLIIGEIKRQMQNYEKQNATLVIIDMPLLFEVNFQTECDASLLIYLPEQLQLERLMTRNKLSRQAAEARIKSQMPLAQKKKQATYIIENTGTITKLERELSDLLIEIGR